MRERGKFYCCFMALMKLNSGLGGALKNDSIFKSREVILEEKGLEQLKQLISIHMCTCASVCRYGFDVMDFLFFLYRLKRKFPLNLNGKFIFGAKLKDFRFENQVC